MMGREVAGVCVVICLLAVSGASFAQDEEHDWQVWAVEDGGNGHEYKVIMEPVNWAAQSALAEEAGGYLATILSAEEQAFVLSVVTAAEGEEEAANGYYWMGLFQDPEGQEPNHGWQWVNDEGPLTYHEDKPQWRPYANWHRIEPNNQGNEDYGAIWVSSGGAWIDGKGVTALRAVIEREDGPAPDTTAPETTITPDRVPDQDGVYTAAVSVSISAADDMSGVEWTKYSVDGGTTWVVYHDPLAFDATGTYVIQAYSQDVAGNVETPPVGLVIVLDLNGPPVADAGEDETLEATGNPGAEVQLDGSGSYDPDGDDLEYAWSWGGGGEATGATPTVLLPLGATEVTLVVNDGTLDSEPDTVLVTVQDTTPPATSIEPDRDAGEGDIYTDAVTVTISATDSACGVAWTKYRILDGAREAAGDWQEYTRPLIFDETGCYTIQAYSQDGVGNEENPPAVLEVIVDLGNSEDTAPPELSLDSPSPAILWPPNGKLVSVTISGNAEDEGSGIAQAWLEVEDEYGELDGLHNIKDALQEGGYFEVQIELVAKRHGRDRDGRKYWISLHAVDEADNAASHGPELVLVPHDRRK